MTSQPNNEDTIFLLSCLHHTAQLPNWSDVATDNGISGTGSVKANHLAQRKFKKIAEASGRYSLEKGKLVLNGATNAPNTNNTTPSTPATPKAKKAPTAAGSAAPKKRGRPVGSGTSKPSKKVKKEVQDDTEEEREDEVSEKAKGDDDTNADGEEEEDADEK